MTTQESKKLAEKIARILESGSQQGEMATIFAAIERINHRLDKIEGSMANPQPQIIRSSHPSLDKLNVAEAIADSIFDGRYKEKACQFEPGKPCDHCSMCNTRGF